MKFFHEHTFSKNIKFTDPLWFSVAHHTNATTIINEWGESWDEANIRWVVCKHDSAFN